MKTLMRKFGNISAVLLVIVLSMTITVAQEPVMEPAAEKGAPAQGKKTFYYKIEDLPETVLIPEENIKTRFLLTERVLISFINVPPGAVFPIHTHDAEQILIILEGEEHHEIDGVKYIMKPGDVAIHPSGIPHGGHPGPNGFKGIDIFTPPRISHVKLMEEQGTLPDEFGNYHYEKK